MQQSLFEKLEITSEKNFLIQGLPSSIEKQFIKLSYSKNVTPLLRIKRIDFALVFAINGNQLNGILTEVIPNLSKEGKLWVAYPKSTSKIASDLNRDHNWQILVQNNFKNACEVTLDHCWNALRFVKQVPVVEERMLEVKKVEVKGPDFDKNLVVPPAELEKIFTRHQKAREVFQNLSATNQEEYVAWIEGAKRQDTRTRRLEATVEKLLAGKKSPLEK
ncbi:MAG: hypothetical protein JWQ40_3264 [Segetibacter sp.]|jgi:hypothetical protein|nr:hypothetical protein [Segetibacter sp.]